MAAGRRWPRWTSAYVVGLEGAGAVAACAALARVRRQSPARSGPTMPYACASRPRPWGCPLGPRRSMLGHRYLRRRGTRTGRLPVLSSGERLLALPALYPDVRPSTFMRPIASVIAGGHGRGDHGCRPRIWPARPKPHHYLRAPDSKRRRSLRPTQTVIRFLCRWSAKFRTAAIRATMPYDISRMKSICASGSTWKESCEPGCVSRPVHYNVQDFADYLQLCGGLPRCNSLRRSGVPAGPRFRLTLSRKGTGLFCGR